MTVEQSLRYPQENIDYFYIENVFSDDDVEWIKTQQAERHIPEHYREIIWEPAHLHLTFSSNHQVENLADQIKKTDSNQRVFSLSQQLIQRLGQELKLKGQHKIVIQFVRYKPVSGETLGQAWHFDYGASFTMIAVLQNDFNVLNKGLDISYNEVKGPFSGKEVSTKEQALPLNKKWKILSYPDKGAIIFNNAQGKIIHRMTTLPPKTFDFSNPLTRTIVQIKLLDPTWK